jgi:hypothetical protein
VNGELLSAASWVFAGLAALAYARDLSVFPISGWRWVPLWLIVIGTFSAQALTQPAGGRAFSGGLVCTGLVVGFVRRVLAMSRAGSDPVDHERVDDRVADRQG